MSDSAAIDTALLSLLAGDVILQSLAPDGVYWDEAPPHVTRFVVLSLVEEADIPEFQQRAYEDMLYLVKAVLLKQTGVTRSTASAAAARIDTLLDGARLLASGYTPMTCAREARVNLVEVDDTDDTIRWFHAGGNYRVQMSL